MLQGEEEIPPNIPEYGKDVCQENQSSGLAFSHFCKQCYSRLPLGDFCRSRDFSENLTHVYIDAYAFNGSKEFYLSCCDFDHRPRPRCQYMPFELEPIASFRRVFKLSTSFCRPKYLCKHVYPFMSRGGKRSSIENVFKKEKLRRGLCRKGRAVKVIEGRINWSIEESMR